MTSTVDQMRENREVLAEITETARTITEVTPEARAEIVALQQTARHMRRFLTSAGLVLAAISVLGGLAGGALVAFVAFRLL
ncbi:MAG: hypothetical protein OXG74_02440 [Acidobacteria bacterium]|nr:hypothetical protein [Acidobacteriota bacterium]